MPRRSAAPRSRRRELRRRWWASRRLWQVVALVAGLALFWILSSQSHASGVALLVERVLDELPPLLEGASGANASRGALGRAARVRNASRDASAARAALLKPPPTTLVLGAVPSLPSAESKARLRVAVRSLRLAGFDGAIVLGLHDGDVDGALARFLQRNGVNVLPTRFAAHDVDARYAWLVAVLGRAPRELARVLVAGDLLDTLFQSDPFRSRGGAAAGERRVGRRGRGDAGGNAGGDAAACAAWNSGAKSNATTTNTVARVTVFGTARTFGEPAALATSLAALQKLLPHPDSCREGSYAIIDEAAWEGRSVVAPLLLGARAPVLSLLKALSRSVAEHRCGASAALAPALMEEAYLNLLVYNHAAHRASRIAAAPVIVVPHGGGCVVHAAYMRGSGAAPMLRDSEGFVLRPASLARAAVVTGVKPWAPVLDDWIHHTFLNASARVHLDAAREARVLRWLEDGRVLRVGDKLRKIAKVSFLLFTVTFHANHAHDLTRSP